MNTLLNKSCPWCQGTRLMTDEGDPRPCIYCDKIEQWKAHLGELVNENYAKLKTTPLLSEYPTHKALIIEYDAPEVLKAHIKCFLKRQKDEAGLPLLRGQWKELLPDTIMKESITGQDTILRQWKIVVVNLGGGGPGFPKYPAASERHTNIIAARAAEPTLFTWVAIQFGLESIMREDKIGVSLKNTLKAIERSRSIRLSAANTEKLAPETPNEKLRNVGFGLRGVDTTLLSLNPKLDEFIKRL